MSYLAQVNYKGYDEPSLRYIEHFLHLSISELDLNVVKILHFYILDKIFDGCLAHLLDRWNMARSRANVMKWFSFYQGFKIIVFHGGHFSGQHRKLTSLKLNHAIRPPTHTLALKESYNRNTSLYTSGTFRSHPDISFFLI